MQRRAAGQQGASNRAASPPPASSRLVSRNRSGGGGGGGGTRRGGGSGSGSGSGNCIFNPLVILIGLAVGLMGVSWWLFPDEVVQVEHQAETVGHEMAQKALRVEHGVEDWWQNHHQQQQQQQQQQQPPPQGQERTASETASARMAAQSSKWVDGEKKLKQKLSELAAKQQEGELLGVPVLTRWLGDDFPAWVTPDMDEAQWRKDVAAKYKDMRDEEEVWKKEMQTIINQRQHDLEMTTDQ